MDVCLDDTMILIVEDVPNDLTLEKKKICKQNTSMAQS
jgi:hypothetical protein